MSISTLSMIMMLRNLWAKPRDWRLDLSQSCIAGVKEVRLIIRETNNAMGCRGHWPQGIKDKIPRKVGKYMTYR